MQKCLERTLGVLVAFAALVALAGCASGAAKLPQCSGRAEPINVPAGAPATAGSVNGGH